MSFLTSYIEVGVGAGAHKLGSWRGGDLQRDLLICLSSARINCSNCRNGFEQSTGLAVEKAKHWILIFFFFLGMVKVKGDMQEIGRKPELNGLGFLPPFAFSGKRIHFSNPLLTV